MILVVGGQGAGKRRYVAELGFGEEDIFADLHVFLKTTAEADEALLENLLRKKVVICNEVGCGVVPMSAEERAWRDRVGRICARLAARAERVVRMCCGIPVVIKDSGKDAPA